MPSSPSKSPASQIAFEMRGQVALIRLARPTKRNAMNDALIADLRASITSLPDTAKVAVIHGEGEHFSAGLDLSELRERDVVEGMYHSRMWHEALDKIQFGRVPVIAALHGAVIGGGLELACVAHLRVADETAFYGLPEGQRGIFVGGGGSVRIPRLIGVARMTDLMMTGRVYDATEGHTAGISQYLVPAGQALVKALEIAERVCGNAPLTNYALMHVLPRINEQGMDQGLITESMIAAIAQSSPEAKKRLRDFLEGRAEKVKPTDAD